MYMKLVGVTETEPEFLKEALPDLYGKVLQYVTHFQVCLLEWLEGKEKFLAESEKLLDKFRLVVLLPQGPKVLKLLETRSIGTHD